jgi:Cupin domain
VGVAHALRRSGRPAPCRALHRRNRPERQWLFPRQGRPRETDQASGIPYTIIRATQFLEFLGGIADSSADVNIVRLPPGLFQPIASNDVAPVVAEVALAAPRNASSKPPARHERHSTKSSPAIGYSPGHTHPKSAFIYATVLEGAIRSQVNDGPVTTYKAGQSFSELPGDRPGDRHAVSANASETQPAKLLAVCMVDANGAELTVPFGN